jgi:hypothetical protein
MSFGPRRKKARRANAQVSGLGDEDIHAVAYTFSSAEASRRPQIQATSIVLPSAAAALPLVSAIQPLATDWDLDSSQAAAEVLSGVCIVPKPKHQRRVNSVRSIAGLPAWFDHLTFPPGPSSQGMAATAGRLWGRTHAPRGARRLCQPTVPLWMRGFTVLSLRGLYRRGSTLSGEHRQSSRGEPFPRRRGESDLCTCRFVTKSRATAQEWKDLRFHRTTLRALGLILQLGHCVGRACSRAALGPADFTVLHTNGLHHVRVLFCGCNHSLLHWTQLLRSGLWPATVLEPHTAATFAVLRDYQHKKEHGQITAGDYYRALVSMTDARLITSIPVRVSAAHAHPC